MAISIIYSTFPNRESAAKIAETMLNQRLIACSNSFSIESQYCWQGKSEKEDETGILFKTSTEKEDLVFQKIAELHPYEVPCIWSQRVKSIPAYEQWVEESVSLSE